MLSSLPTKDTGSVPANLWRQTGHPTGPWWSDATARAGYAMTTTTMKDHSSPYTSVLCWHFHLPPAVFTGTSYFLFEADNVLGAILQLLILI